MIGFLRTHSVFSCIAAYLLVGWAVSVAFYVALELIWRKDRTGRFVTDPAGDDLWTMCLGAVFWPVLVLCAVGTAVVFAVSRLRDMFPSISPEKVLFVYPVRIVFSLLGFRNDRACGSGRTSVRTSVWRRERDVKSPECDGNIDEIGDADD